MEDSASLTIAVPSALLALLVELHRPLSLHWGMTAWSPAFRPWMVLFEQACGKSWKDEVGLPRTSAMARSSRHVELH